MVSDMVNAVKNAENLALDKQKKAAEQADLIVDNAKKDAQAILKTKIKEAKAKANLRINFAKSSAEEIAKKNFKNCDEIIKNLNERLDKSKASLIKTVINLIVN